MAKVVIGLVFEGFDTIQKEKCKMNTKSFLKSMSLIALFSATAYGQTFPNIDWTSGACAPLPEPRSQITSAVVGGRIFVFGDNNGTVNPTDASVYDPDTDTWSAIAPMLTPRGQAAAAAVNGKIYLFGGNNCFSNCWLTTNEMYDPSTDTWETRAPMPTTDRGFLSATEFAGKIHVMGGADSYDNPSTYDIHEIYDPATDSWTIGPPLPTRRAHHAAVKLDGKIYLIGGVTRDASNDQLLLTDVDVYDPSTGTWTQTAPLPTPRMDPSAIVWGGRIIVIGGFAHPTGPWLDVVEAYDPATDTWQELSPLPQPWGWGAAEVVADRFYVIGGVNDLNPDGLADVICGTPAFSCFADLNGDGVVNGADLATLLSNWGVCP